MLLNSIQNDDVAVQLIATLFIAKTAEVLRLAELLRTLGKMLLHRVNLAIAAVLIECIFVCNHST